MAMTTAKTTDFTSILGHRSRLYQTKTQDGGGILDIPERGILEFYCTGYTKPDKNGQNRQFSHKDLFAYTVYSNTNGKLYPFNKQDYRLDIVHDPHNKYDVNGAAMHVMFTPISNELRAYFKLRDSQKSIDLGFVPARINSLVLDNFTMINDAEILKVREGFHHKYYTTKVVINYGHNKRGFEASNCANRFLELIDEL